MLRKGAEVFLMDSNAGLEISNQGWFLVNLNEYLLEQSRDVVGRENNHSAVAWIMIIFLSVS